jgi:hypothetical protein
MTLIPQPTREEILASYRAGPEAVVVLIAAWWERIAT